MNELRAKELLKVSMRSKPSLQRRLESAQFRCTRQAPKAFCCRATMWARRPRWYLVFTDTPLKGACILA